MEEFVTENRKLLYCHSGHSDIYVGGYGHTNMFVEGGGLALPICLRPRNMGIRHWLYLSFLFSFHCLDCFCLELMSRIV